MMENEMIFNNDDKYYLLVHSKNNNEAMVSKLNNVNMTLVQDYLNTKMYVEGSLSTVKHINLTSIDEITDEDIKNILENQ